MKIRNYRFIIFFAISVRVFDRWTCNQTCFNAARALKPLNNGEAKPINGVDLPLGSKVPGCDFCSPLDHTAAGTMCMRHCYVQCVEEFRKCYFLLAEG